MVMALSGCSQDPGEKLWSQDFNDPSGTSFDSKYWTAEIGDGGSKGIPGWGNNEREYYIEDSAVQDGEGNLKIIANKMPVFSKENPDGAPTDENPYFCYYLTACEWTSGRYVTEGKVNFKYGRIEARLKMPEGIGTWPAFWMLGSDIGEVGWPQSGEIDIIEGLGRDPMTAYGTIHGPGYFGGNGFSKTLVIGDSLSADFHTYAINWKPDYISWEIDGQVFHEATPSDVAPNQWVFNKPFYLIINLAMGGNFAGNVDPKLTSAELVVDFIRYSKYEGFGELITLNSESK